MKRSEMIEILTAVISAPRVKFDARTIAQDVLSAIEEKGMLPPYRAVRAFEANFTWEPEDETISKES